MAGYGEALEFVRGAIEGAGVAAVLDPADLNLPGVWVEPDGLTPAYLDGGFDARVTCVLVVPDNGVIESLDSLTELLATILGGTDLAIGDVEATRAILRNHSADPLPAFKFTATVQLTN